MGVFISLLLLVIKAQDQFKAALFHLNYNVMVKKWV